MNKYLLTLFFFSSFSLAQIHENYYEFDRVRMDLEQYELEKLSFIQADDFYPNTENYVLVFDPNGYIHRLFLNDYVGKNHGQLKEINNFSVVIREIHKLNGDWSEVYITIKLRN